MHPSLPQRKTCSLRFILLLWLLAGILCSCALFGGQRNDEEALRLTADRFNRALRWEDYQAAAARVAPSRREVFWGLVDRMQGQVRVMDYQVVDVVLNGKDGLGTVTLRYRFFLKRKPQLQTVMVHQKWAFSDRDQTWQVVKDDLDQLLP